MLGRLILIGWLLATGISARAQFSPRDVEGLVRFHGDNALLLGTPKRLDLTGSDDLSFFAVVGARNTGTTQQLNFDLAELLIYDRALPLVRTPAGPGLPDRQMGR